MHRSHARRGRRLALNDPRVLHVASLAALLVVMVIATLWIRTESQWLQPVALVGATVLGWSVHRLNRIS